MPGITKKSSGGTVDLTAVNAAIASAQSTATTAQASITSVNTAITSLQAGQSTGFIAYQTLALLNADLAKAANTPAMVTNDVTASNNGYYIKVGASGAGSWTKSTYVPSTVIAAKTVTRTQLADDWRSSGAEYNGSLDALTTEGTWYGNGYNTNQPIAMSNKGTIIVTKTTATTGIQTFYKQGKIDEVYVRTFDTTVPSFTAFVLYPYTGILDNAVTTTKVANKAVSRPKLGDDWRSTGVELSADLNTFLTEGMYYTNGYNTNQPVGMSVKGALNVTKTGLTTGIQTFYKQGKVDEVYIRTFDSTIPSFTPFVLQQKNPLTNISRNMLSDQFSLVGNLLASVDLNTLTAEGLYYAPPTIINAPTEYATGNGNLFIEVKRFYNNGDASILYVMQKVYYHSITKADTGYDFYYRFFDSTYMAATKWIPSTPRHPRYGKKYMAIGDSIAAGIAGYPMIVANTLGLVATNVAFSGSAMAKRASVPEYDSHSFPGATSGNATVGYSYITVSMGVNDCSSNVPLGSISSTTETEFYGAMNVGLANIYAVNPTARIIFISPTWKNGETWVNSVGLTIQAYRDAIVDFCNRNNLPVIIMDKKLGINSANYTSFLTDGLHPNDNATKYYADFVSGQMSTLM